MVKKLLGIILVLGMLLAMIPVFAAPAGAAPAGPYLTMSMIDLITGLPVPDSGYNVAGSIVQVNALASNGSPLTGVTGWSLQDVVPGMTASTFVPAGQPGAVNSVEVQGDWGETIISATLSTGNTISIDKKWGKIANTTIDDTQSIPVTWYEGGGVVGNVEIPIKSYFGTTEVTDVVTGDFVNEFGVHSMKPVQGVILNWFLLHGSQTIPMGPAEVGDLLPTISGLPQATFASFSSTDDDVQTMQTVSDGSGSSTLPIFATGEESVTVVVVPQYPIPIQLNVVPEVTTVNFWTREMEQVPQVRWAGEKIVLEKNFGTAFHPLNAEGNENGDLYLVRFSLENQSAGALEGIGNTFLPAGGLNLINTAQTVWTTVDANGLASVMLVSQDPGEIHVDATLYLYEGFGTNGNNMTIENQHEFLVYYLKLESLKLENVVGKRDGETVGDWTPANPWDDTLSPTLNVLAETLNVSQDTLLRARVKGWFTNSNPSVRPEATLDINNDGVPDLTLPAGRWVLPDDWAALAGPNWQQDRIHWDIMDAPNDLVWAPDQLGSYNTVNGQTDGDVIGPFSPGIELMTPLGWDVTFESPDSARDIKTVVPNGDLNWWDAPMPPAKIIFEINDVSVMAGQNDIGNSGFFKAADKGGIYYLIVNGQKVYTNPFYQELIPANEAIPATNNNGGYDWNSFDTDYGPYQFWTIINRPDLNAAVPTADPAGHPTKVEVYSDNHGEAMVYLNGDWNLNLQGFGVNGAADVSPGATVGSTTVQAMADYPYQRGHQPILSNTVVKTWTWGGLVLGTDSHMFLDGVIQDTSTIINTTGNYVITTPGGANPPSDVGTSDKKMVWLWISDRDGQQAGVLGAKVTWRITGGGNSVYISGNNGELSNYNDVTKNIMLSNGFLANTSGMLTSPFDGTQGTSMTRKPTAAEAELFNKFYDLNANDFVVAGIEVKTSNPLLDVTVVMDITSPDYLAAGLTGGTISRNANVDFAAAYPMDDDILHGDASVDGIVNMGDVTATELQILGLQGVNINADANGDGKINMADVIKIQRIILGLH